MDKNQLLKNKTPGFYLGLIGGILNCMALIIYIMYEKASGDHNGIIAAVLLGAVIIQIISVFKENDALSIAAPLLSLIALCSFLSDSVYTLVGYFMKLDMFGDVTMMGYIARVSILTGIAVVVLTVAAFMRKNKA